MTDLSHGGRLSLARSVLWFLGSYGIAVLAYLGVNVVAARLIGAEGFGMFVVVLTATNLIGLLGVAGAHRGGLRLASRLHPDQHDYRVRLAELRQDVRAVSALSLPVASLLAAIAAGAYAERSGTAHPVLLAGVTGLLVFLSGQQKLTSHYLRGLGWIRFANLLEGRSGGALVALGQAVLIAGVWWLFPQWGLVGALGAMAAGYLLALLPAYVMLHRVWGGLQDSVGLRRAFARVASRDWKFTVVQTGAYLNSTLDVWIASILLSGLATSQFAAAQRLSQLVLIPATSLVVVIAPAISRLSFHRDPRLQPLLRTGSSLATVAAAVLAAPMVLAPIWALDLVFGDGFADAWPILVLLALSYLGNAVTGSASTALSMTSYEGVVATAQWWGVGLRVLGGALAAWAFGVVGLAVASALATLYVYAALWWSARRRMGLRTHLTLRPQLSLLARVGG